MREIWGFYTVWRMKKPYLLGEDEEEGNEVIFELDAHAFDPVVLERHMDYVQ